MSMRIAHVLLSVLLLGVGLAGGCGGKGEAGGGFGPGGALAGAPGTGGAQAGLGGSGSGIAGMGPLLNCQPSGSICAGDTECCSNHCNPLTNQCDSSLVECKPSGAACSSPLDCCTLSCTGGSCSETACIADNQACQAPADCCSGACDNGSCTPLTSACSTAGNPCNDTRDCCSGLCQAGTCKVGASFCVQRNDACGKSTDCCSGICTKAANAALGTCAAPPSAPTNCGKVNGEVCNGCGECCSRLCAPYGPTGVPICQPAQGCRINGELCREDRDCCGAAGTGLPGAGNVTCHKDPGAEFGRCRNPMGCNPQGNVCHYQNYQCDNSTSPAQCCGDTNKKLEFCQLDTLGVPRCNGLGECRNEGETCATSLDCCAEMGLLCLPNQAGDLVCRKLDTPEQCVPAQGGCTSNADCCAGTICQLEIGASRGICGVREVPPPGTGGAGGAGGAGNTGGSSNTGGNAPVCAEFGQLCSQSNPCCNSVPCTEGRCNYPVR